MTIHLVRLKNAIIKLIFGVFILGYSICELQEPFLMILFPDDPALSWKKKSCYYFKVQEKSNLPYHHRHHRNRRHHMTWLVLSPSYRNQT
jgi:hypothetical protein